MLSYLIEVYLMVISQMEAMIVETFQLPILSDTLIHYEL